MRHIVIPLSMVFVYMALFVSMTPFAADDYSYYFATGTFENIINAEIEQYFTWTGRSVAHIIGRILVLSHPMVHCITTASVFTGLFVCIFIFIYGRSWYNNVDFFQVLLLFSLLWFSVPAFGTVFFWRLGVANYLWPLLFIFGFMAAYRILAVGHLIQPSLAGTAGLCLLGLLAGWSNENSGVLPFFFGVGALVLQYRQHKVISLRLCLPLLFVLAGFALLICAPGNYQRILHESEHVRQVLAMGILEKTPYYLDKMLMALGMYFPAPLAAALLFWRCHRLGVTKTVPCRIGLLCVLMALMATAALFFSPSYALRTFTSISVLYSAGACAFFAASPFPSSRRWLIAGLGGVMFCLVGYELYLFSCNWQVHQARLAAYAEAAPGGVAVVPGKFPHIDKFFFIGGDIKDMEYARSIARYYNVGSIHTR